jgi:hypothetical protein
MNIRLFSAIVLGLALGVTAYAQDENPAPPAGQSPDQGPGGGGRQGHGQRGGRGGWGEGSGLMGTVTQVAADHFTIKNDSGEIYTVYYSANTRIFKQSAQQRGMGGRGEGGRGEGGNQRQEIKSTDIKVGDAIGARGEVDAAAKSVGAVVILQMDPERVRQMEQMQANYGKTWLAGKVTAVDGVKVTLMGMVDHAAHTFVADENTTFRKRRDPITLSDMHVGDMVRVRGEVNAGAFRASSVMVMEMPPGGMPMVPRGSQPESEPQ